MKTSLKILTILLLTFAWNAEAQISPPVIEQYSFEMGNSVGQLTFLDEKVGAGSAQMRFELRPCQNAHEIRLEVFRHVAPGQVIFALLLERVQITFLNAGGVGIRTVTVDGESLGEGGLFIIGDSNDGYYRLQRTFKGLNSARRVTISLFGNYE
jgi:hypothetical protein